MCSVGGWDYIFQVFKLKQFLSRNLLIVFTKLYIWIAGKEKKKQPMLDSLFFPQICDYVYYIRMHSELKISFSLQVKIYRVS